MNTTAQSRPTSREIIEDRVNRVLDAYNGAEGDLRLQNYLQSLKWQADAIHEDMGNMFSDKRQLFRASAVMDQRLTDLGTTFDLTDAAQSIVDQLDLPWDEGFTKVRDFLGVGDIKNAKTTAKEFLDRIQKQNVGTYGSNARKTLDKAIAGGKMGAETTENLSKALTKGEQHEDDGKLSMAIGCYRYVYGKAIGFVPFSRPTPVVELHERPVFEVPLAIKPQRTRRLGGSRFHEESVTESIEKRKTRGTKSKQKEHAGSRR